MVTYYTPQSQYQTMFRYRLNAEQCILEIIFKQDLQGTQVDKMRENVFQLIACPELRDSRWSVLVIDLLQVTAIDSMGMNFLISLVHAGKRSAAQVKLKIARLSIYQVFQFIRMNEIAEIELVRSEDEDSMDPGL